MVLRRYSLAFIAGCILSLFVASAVCAQEWEAYDIHSERALDAQFLLVDPAKAVEDRARYSRISMRDLLAAATTRYVAIKPANVASVAPPHFTSDDFLSGQRVIGRDVGLALTGIPTSVRATWLAVAVPIGTFDYFAYGMQNVAVGAVEDHLIKRGIMTINGAEYEMWASRQRLSHALLNVGTVLFFDARAVAPSGAHN